MSDGTCHVEFFSSNDVLNPNRNQPDKVAMIVS